MSQTTHEPVDDRSTDAGLNTEARYDLLADGRRRLALAELAERSAPVALEDLATAVAARETEAPSPSVDVVERVAVSLHHAHLPRAADLGVVDYDPETKQIERVGTVPTTPSA
ncbi:DUF7344 domain-containing protein [Halosimplex amylolyticum]|uniref:DUF7344 domain-containing protein n=1 Tax=Halosimplex amylolyticum TaxID=3396616 RepID=UPI003F57172D